MSIVVQREVRFEQNDRNFLDDNKVVNEGKVEIISDVEKMVL